MRAASRASVVALGFALVSIAACGGDDDASPAEDAASSKKNRRRRSGRSPARGRPSRTPTTSTNLAVSIITAQFFSGDPVPGASFIDPDIFDEVMMLDGYGDVAFTTGGGYYFYDDPVAGTLHFTDVDMGDADAPPAHTAEEQEAMFRTFHDRVAG